LAAVDRLTRFRGMEEKCVWVRPEILAQIEFLEWTDANLHLRHSKFAGLRDDKASREVVKEDPTG